MDLLKALNSRNNQLREFQAKHPLVYKTIVDALLEVHETMYFKCFIRGENIMSEQSLADFLVGKKDEKNNNGNLISKSSTSITNNEITQSTKKNKDIKETKKKKTNSPNNLSDLLGITPKEEIKADIKGIGLRKRDIERSQKAKEKEEAKDSSLSDFLNPHTANAVKNIATNIQKAKEIVTRKEERNAGDILAKFETKQIEKRLKEIKTISYTGPKDIDFDDSQLAALQGLEEQQFACLIGAAGTGKTTVTKELVSRIEKHVETIHIGTIKNKDIGKKEIYNVAIAFCAFTGRAVQQIKRALPKEYWSNCSTIHKLLGFHPIRIMRPDKDNLGHEKEIMIFVPAFDENNKLPYQVIIIDEAGMVPIGLWNQLWAACEPGTKIILIGDINQLPPVIGHSVLGWAMKQWPTFELTTIHRQAQDNPIIMNAHRILKGQFPQPVKGKFDIVPLTNSGIESKGKMLAAVRKLHKQERFNEIEDAIIVPQNVGVIGQEMLNEQLVMYFNGKKAGNIRYTIAGGWKLYHYATGDKVMLLQNDNELGLTNGMTGVIVNIAVNGRFSGKKSQHAQIAVDNPDRHIELDMADDDWDKFDAAIGGELEKAGALDEKSEDDKNQRQASHIITVQFDGDIEVDFTTSGEYNKLTYAYAFTCHKSQGGEYPTVIIVCHSTNHLLLSREWLYTAVTRAQNHVILLSNDRGLTKALKRQHIKGKTLKEKIQAFIDMESKAMTDTGNKDNTVPNLPEPKRI